MSSGNIDTQLARHLFEARNGLDRDGYAIVTYLIGSSRGGEECALAMAMEQSAATTFIPNYQMIGELERFTAKVLSVEEVGTGSEAEAVSYDLETEVYEIGGRGEQKLFRVKIGFPLLLLHRSPSQWFNVLIGEIPRLGFITSLQVEDIEVKVPEGEGPALGVEGIRRKTGVKRGPILCRSTRPAVGLDQDTMRRINFDVLSNGFHAVKDDELQAWADSTSYRAHVEAMVASRRAAEDASGEKKFYIANLLCDANEVERRLEIASTAGADGLLVAPAIQGLSILPWVKSQSSLPILAHNSGCEIFTRYPHWRIAPALYLKLQRYWGADWLVTTGDFSSATADAEEGASIVNAAQGALDGAKPSLLILQGGKHPGVLSDCVDAVGSLDFMLVVASWVDGHPRGLNTAARIFRESIDALSCGI